MRSVVQYLNQLSAKRSLRSASTMFLLLFPVLFLAAVKLSAQCPDSGETKVIKPSQGTGYYFYKFLGDSSFVYFLDGHKFSFNDKDDPGRTFVFIDDFAYESTLVERAELSKYVKSSDTLEVLRAQARHHQEYFKTAVPSILITDYGPATMKNTDGSDGRIFYLWKKQSPPGAKAATQYLVSTLIKRGVVVLSVMLNKDSLSEDDALLQIRKYTTHFDLITSTQCSIVLSAPTAP